MKYVSVIILGLLQKILLEKLITSNWETGIIETKWLNWREASGVGTTWVPVRIHLLDWHRLALFALGTV